MLNFSYTLRGTRLWRFQIVSTKTPKHSINGSIYARKWHVSTSASDDADDLLLDFGKDSNLIQKQGEPSSHGSILDTTEIVQNYDHGLL